MWLSCMWRLGLHFIIGIEVHLVTTSLFLETFNSFVSKNAEEDAELSLYLSWKINLSKRN